MPIYEYRRADGTTFEVMQSFSDDPLTADPETGEPVERVFRPPAIHFKGKGFHNTDYGTRKRNREKESSESGSGSSDAKPSSDGGGGEKTSDSSSSSSPASSPSKSSSD
jgi:putative FmdB family regulatory protein